MTDQAAQTNTSAGEGENAESTGASGSTLMTSDVDNQDDTSATGNQGEQAESNNEGDSGEQSGDESNTGDIDYSDIQYPDNVEADDLSEAMDFIKENNLDKDLAQKLIDREARLLEEANKSQEDRDKEVRERLQRQSDDWRAETINDPDIGGDKLKANMQLANKARLAFGSDELTQFLERTGYGNHKMFVKMFVNIGKAISEDKFHLPGSEGGSTKSAAEVLYPSASNG